MTLPLVDLELKGPLPNQGPYPGAEAVLALLRWRGRPVGLLRVPTQAGWVRAPQWQAALALWCQQPAARAALAEPCPLDGATPAFSIIIATHERPVDLRRCLLALAPLAAQFYEIVVVDSAPRSNVTAAVVGSLDFPIRYLCEPRPGLGHARNTGWRAARHALIAFLDDDAQPDPDWATQLGRALAQPQVAGVAGLVLPLTLDTHAQVELEAWANLQRGFTRREFKAALASRLPPQPLVARVLEANAPALDGAGGLGLNLALRRDWLARVGGFDPRLEPGAQSDLQARVFAAGGRLVYLPEAVVRQAQPTAPASARRVVFEHGLAQGSLAAKHLWEEGDPRPAGALLQHLALSWQQGLHPPRHSPPTPLALLLTETAGALAGPFRFWQATHTPRAGVIAPAGPHASQKTS